MYRIRDIDNLFRICWVEKLSRGFFLDPRTFKPSMDEIKTLIMSPNRTRLTFNELAIPIKLQQLNMYKVSEYGYDGFFP